LCGVAMRREEGAESRGVEERSDEAEAGTACYALYGLARGYPSKLNHSKDCISQGVEIHNPARP
jgi:hypothetical protein